MIAALVSLLGGWRAAGFAALALVAWLAVGTQTIRLHNAQGALAGLQRDVAQAQADAQAKANAIERAQADASAQAATQYEQGKTDASTTADRLLVDLLNRNVWLQPRWQCPTSRVPQASPSPTEPDATAADRAASASRIVRAAAACDAQVIALQALVISERQ
jgi:uncharacterized membrane-anchored protein YhcB (DUF1043 family)